jgi:hypothetical protein
METRKVPARRWIWPAATSARSRPGRRATMSGCAGPRWSAARSLWGPCATAAWASLPLKGVKDRGLGKIRA